jgi:uncharacterized protein (DUF2336 family)
MQESSSKLSELEDLLRLLPPGKRSALLKSVTAMFAENNARYRPAQVVLFDRLLNQLICEPEREATAEFSRRIAALPSQPIKVVDRLARNDDIAIAEPVLMRSSCLDDSTLGEIARTKGQTHLLAIACRPRLTAEIVDLLLARGDEVVVRYVANNRGAQISEKIADALIERARSDETLAILVRQRHEIADRLGKSVPPGARAPAA